jgi:hypothetical protein
VKTHTRTPYLGHIESLERKIGDNNDESRQYATCRFGHTLSGYSKRTRTVEVRHPPRSGWLDELGRLKGGRAVGLGVARCAP